MASHVTTAMLLSIYMARHVYSISLNETLSSSIVQCYGCLLPLLWKYARIVNYILMLLILFLLVGLEYCMLTHMVL